jgi:hypothetical protein
LWHRLQLHVSAVSHCSFCCIALQVCDRLGARRSERAAEMVTPPGQPHVMLDSRLLPPLRAPLTPDASSVGESDVHRLTLYVTSWACLTDLWNRSLSCSEAALHLMDPAACAARGHVAGSCDVGCGALPCDDVPLDELLAKSVPHLHSSLLLLGNMHETS